MGATAAEDRQLARWLTQHGDVLSSPPSTLVLTKDGSPVCACGYRFCDEETEEMRRYDAWWQREFESGRYDYVEGVG